MCGVVGRYHRQPVPAAVTRQTFLSRSPSLVNFHQPPTFEAQDTFSKHSPSQSNANEQLVVLTTTYVPILRPVINLPRPASPRSRSPTDSTLPVVLLSTPPYPIDVLASSPTRAISASTFRTTESTYLRDPSSTKFRHREYISQGRLSCCDRFEMPCESHLCAWGQTSTGIDRVPVLRAFMKLAAFVTSYKKNFCIAVLAFMGLVLHLES